ncbi:P-loop containing nucleoside triphosphate hydrolases superfamily protein isoform 1 [Theobroma cacao]|uniref:P-loop containing nucleoside triphosphate hydrolases superfamily protein isoform 1 n=1 Tax=Theobroma cacao TaxID=3641 RepID=A0A061DLX1_THECC|nr:P-loop containing nucleoside triphosphate hydrolases superfamily protein isoform 1 [Theobroma cacao]EOX90983.1 P-loop containing nucleoside triphosphate hydrolases superfamily protein isoform 1 [Theobroma cacao]
MATLLKELPSLSALVSAYASISAMAMLIRTMLNEMLPERMRNYIASKFSELTSAYFSSDFTFVIEDRWQAADNLMFRAAEVYLPTRIGPSSDSLLVGCNDSSDPTAPPKRSIPVDCTITDDFEGMRLKWTFSSIETKKCYVPNKRFFSLTCNKILRERVEQEYLPYISKTAQEILKKRESLSIYTYDQEYSMWECAVFKHPATFETLAMEPELRQFIMDDLDSFVQRKEFFANVGRAWKRGYLLHGPPGTGKSSLVAAMANYMRYDIYDLQFQSVRNDADLRRILTSTTNQSILLIEDIDCSTNVSRDRAKVKEEPGEEDGDESNRPSPIDPGVTLSGLLNFIDGLWSSCGNERIIIFTTNHKEKLDPALLRPGRMDVHIYMGYCTPAGFRKLAATYLGIKDDKLFACIDDLIKSVEVTPAEMAQQLMISDEPEAALNSLIQFLNTKKTKMKEGGAQEEEKTVEEKDAEKKIGERQKNSEHAEIEKRCIYLT